MWKSFLVKFSFQFAAHIYLWRKEEEIFNCFYQSKSFASRKKHNVRLILVQLVFYINIHSVFPPCVTHMSFIVWPVPLLDHCHHHHHNQHPNRHHHQHHHHHHMQIMFSSISPLQVSLASYCEAHLYIIGLSNWHCPIFQDHHSHDYHHYHHDDHDHDHVLYTLKSWQPHSPITIYIIHQKASFALYCSADHHIIISSPAFHLLTLLGLPDQLLSSVLNIDIDFFGFFVMFRLAIRGISLTFKLFVNLYNLLCAWSSNKPELHPFSLNQSPFTLQRVRTITDLKYLSCHLSFLHFHTKSNLCHSSLIYLKIILINSKLA